MEKGNHMAQAGGWLWAAVLCAVILGRNGFGNILSTVVSVVGCLCLMAAGRALGRRD